MHSRSRFVLRGDSPPSGTPRVVGSVTPYACEVRPAGLRSERGPARLAASPRRGVAELVEWDARASSRRCNPPASRVAEDPGPIGTPPAICAFVDSAESEDEMVVGEIELPASVEDRLVALILKLRPQHLPHHIADFDHAANAPRSLIGQVFDRRERRARAHNSRRFPGRAWPPRPRATLALMNESNRVPNAVLNDSTSRKRILGDEARAPER
jgi:hypothetical protein